MDIDRIGPAICFALALVLMVSYFGVWPFGKKRPTRRQWISIALQSAAVVWALFRP